MQCSASQGWTRVTAAARRVSVVPVEIAAGAERRSIVEGGNGPMEVRVAVLADAANVAQPSKLNILGIFDTLSARQFPAIHPSMALVVRFRLDYSDANKKHELRVTFRDEDGTQMGGAGSEVVIGQVAPGQFGHANQILNLAGIKFGKPGHYVFEVTWDGEAKARVDLLVQQVPG
jgi:hypothetical protein